MLQINYIVESSSGGGKDVADEIFRKAYEDQINNRIEDAMEKCEAIFFLPAHTSLARSYCLTLFLFVDQKILDVYIDYPMYSSAAFNSGILHQVQDPPFHDTHTPGVLLNGNGGGRK